jgi:hypothetical protein
VRPWTPAARSRLWLALQALFIGAGAWYAATAVAGQWGAVRDQLAGLSPRWTLVGAATALVLFTYVLLIEVWRIVLAGWGGRLAFPAAVHVWFVSNLGKYVPGKVWQIAALSAMAQRRGLSPVAATGAALLVNLANVASGAVLVLAAGAPGLADGTGGGRLAAAALGLIVLLIGGPLLLPPVAARLGRRLGRSIAWPRLPTRALLAATGGTAVAWILYGVAFRLFADAILPGVEGSAAAWVAVYTGSYLAGYLTPAAPGGIVIREVVLVRGMVALGLAAEPDAWLVALASRLWLTVLEIAPALVSLAAVGARLPRRASQGEPS